MMTATTAKGPEEVGRPPRKGFWRKHGGPERELEGGGITSEALRELGDLRGRLTDVSCRIDDAWQLARMR